MAQKPANAFAAQQLANSMTMPHQTAPTAVNPYVDLLVRRAAQAYPFITQYNPLVVTGNGEGYAETWPADEPGAPDWPRPKELPMGRVGVQVFRPNEFGPTDLAAEFLHVDPVAHETRSKLLESMTPAQIEALKSASGDYAMSLRVGQSEDMALQNAVDSALRGYTVGHWPEEANASMGYTKQQKDMLDNLKRYMMTGKR